MNSTSRAVSSLSKESKHYGGPQLKLSSYSISHIIHILELWSILLPFHLSPIIPEPEFFLTSSETTNVNTPAHPELLPQDTAQTTQPLEAQLWNDGFCSPSPDHYCSNNVSSFTYRRECCISSPGVLCWAESPGLSRAEGEGGAADPEGSSVLLSSFQSRIYSCLGSFTRHS